jgi:hypothetical protein
MWKHLVMISQVQPIFHLNSSSERVFGAVALVSNSQQQLAAVLFIISSNSNQNVDASLSFQKDLLTVSARMTHRYLLEGFASSRFAVS